MRYRFVVRRGALLAGLLLLGACVSTPGRGVPSHYAQDTVSAQCLRNPAWCAALSGGEVATGPLQTVGIMAGTVVAATRGLEDDTRLAIRRELELCANQARTDVLLQHRGTFAGPIPHAGECKQMTADKEGRSVTWAIRLGLEMHEAALKCAETKLNGLRVHFSLKPRYRFNRETKEKSLITPEEKAALLRKGGEELKGTLEPDVVIHTGDPLQVQAVYDFKFRCVDFDRGPSWREYPPGHRYAGESQGNIYQEAFGPAEVVPIGPRKGIFW
ncbi:hypothetical protein [Archangium sp.]|uniref:hypothetical protein n=1 Tax=Archangium sp. TaxID=1872627 RepID=UPI002869F498|nr:hypothetical protein [Archangium sp.]